MTAPGLPFHALLPYGRDATSIAFLSAPGTERLYSGVMNSTASLSWIRCLKSRALRRVGLEVLVEQRQLAYLYNFHLERRLRHLDQCLGELAVQRVLAQASNENGDVSASSHDDPFLTIT
jgi:hypothetical protein